MADIDLAPFCARSHDFARYFLYTPIHFDQWTLATDGRIAVRLPRVEGGEEAQDAPIDAMRTLFDRHRPGDEGELPLFDPPQGECACDYCHGSGREGGDYEEDVLSGDPCPACAGTGKMSLINQTSVEIGETIFAARYFQLIRALPFPKLCYASLPGRYEGEDQAPLSFVFDGGIGLLMPMRRPHENHIQLSRPGSVA